MKKQYDYTRVYNPRGVRRRQRYGLIIIGLVLCLSAAVLLVAWR